MSVNQNGVGLYTGASFTPGTAVNKFPDFQLGTRMRGDGGTEYIFVLAGGAITGAGYVCTIDPAYSATQLSTSNDGYGNVVGVAPYAFASGDYGWLQVLGPCNIQVAASCAANVRVNTTATAGQVDDDGSVGAMEVRGMALTTARGGTAGTAAGVLNYPVVGATL